MENAIRPKCRGKIFIFDTKLKEWKFQEWKMQELIQRYKVQD